MNYRLFTGLFILVFALNCAIGRGQGTEKDPNRQALLKIIPEPLPTDVVVHGSPSFYTPENLYEYMDGGGDIFLLYGVRSLMHVELQAKSADITVDVFDMGTVDTAFGIYAAERSSDEPYVPIGTEGYANKGALNFFQDQYYVKLQGFGEGADQALDTLARAISARIGTSHTFPAVFNGLPTENRKSHSEQYIPNDPLGHTFLGPAYMVAYTFDGKESKVFVTIAHDDADAQRRFQQLKQNFVTTGQCKDAPELGEGAIRASNSFEGSILAISKGHYVVLLLSPTPSSEVLLSKVAGALK